MLKTRIAPTPSGYLHIGNALSFLLTWLIARKQGGIIHLRIDDIDSERTRPEYVQDIIETLQWLGIDWDSQTLSQLPKTALYEAYLQRLTDSPAQLYPCYCTRKTIQTTTKHGIYAQTCLPLSPKITLKDEANLRLHIPESATIILHDKLKGMCTVKPAELAGDLVIWQKTNKPAYQLASVVDDLTEGINFIVRGEDLWVSSAFQGYLAEVLGENSFSNITFLHHKLILDEDGHKLSKSAGATSVRALRMQNASPTHFYSAFARFWQMQDVSETPTLQELLDKLFL